MTRYTYIRMGLQRILFLDPSSSGPKQLSVEKPVSDFKRMVLQWEKFLPTEMDIAIQVIKRQAGYFILRL